MDMVGYHGKHLSGSVVNNRLRKEGNNILLACHVFNVLVSIGLIDMSQLLSSLGVHTGAKRAEELESLRAIDIGIRLGYEGGHCL